MKSQLDLEKSYWVQDNLASTRLNPIFSLHLNYLFDKINLSQLLTNNLNKLDSLSFNCWVPRVLHHIHQGFKPLINSLIEFLWGST